VGEHYNKRGDIWRLQAKTAVDLSCGTCVICVYVEEDSDVVFTRADGPTDSPLMCPSNSWLDSSTDNGHINGLSGRLSVGQSARVNTT
jgi:hypothetical protein